MNPIKFRMQSERISFTELQEMTSLSKSTIARVLKGEEIPSSTRLSTLEIIADYLGCPVADFFVKDLPKYKNTVIKSKNISDYKPQPIQLDNGREEYISAPHYERIAYKCISTFSVKGKNTTVEFECAFARDKRNSNVDRIHISDNGIFNETIDLLIQYNSVDLLEQIVFDVLKACKYPFTKFDKGNTQLVNFQHMMGKLLIEATFDFDVSSI